MGTGEQQTGGKRRRKQGLMWLGLLCVIAGIGLIAGWAGLKAWRVRTCLDSGLLRLRTLQDAVPEQAGFSVQDGAAALAELDLIEVGIQLHGLQDDLTCLQDEVHEFLPLAPFLGWLPKVGPDIASAPTLLGMAQELVDGGVLIFDSLSPLVEQMPTARGQSAPGQASTSSAAGPGWDLPQAVAVLVAAQPSLAEAEAKLQHAAELQADVDPDLLSPRLGRLLGLTGRYLPLLRSGVGIAQLAPGLLGGGDEGARTYLILVQNDDERRPTGGWICSMGLLTVDAGRIIDMKFQDSWSVDNLEVPHDVPPDSLFRTLWGGIWLFRDANWSPDFPTSAQVAERILERDQGISVDGVIAVDQQTLQLLVLAMEPLTVEPSAETVTGANVLPFIRQSWAEPLEGLTQSKDWSEWTAHRKDFMAYLAKAMVAKLQNQPQGLDLTKLVGALWRGLQERHILVYLHEPEAARLLASQGWDGSVLQPPGDYLQVVDANVGFNKVDSNVQRAIQYHVDLTEPNQAESEAVVQYENRSQRSVETCLQGIEWLESYDERMHGCYWDYVRFYGPEGARLLTTERQPLPSGSLLYQHRFAPLGDAGPDTDVVEKGKAAFGLFFVLEPGAKRDVRLAWQLPAGTVQKEADGWHYRLLVQKQSGTPAIPLRVTLSLPPGSQIVAARPDPSGIQADNITFEGSLGTDQSIELVFDDTGGNIP